MKKIIYKTEQGISVVIPASKENIEKVLGPLTDAQYENHVIERSIPKDTLYRFVDDTDIPSSREFRNAWVDVTPESSIDICCTKAKEIALTKLRLERNEMLEKTDKLIVRALESGNQVEIDALKSKRKALRDATEVLKSKDTKDVFNDNKLLYDLSRLSKLNEDLKID